MMFFIHVDETKIFQEMSPENRKFWFDFQDKKFLHNIDTFYYSVKYQNDFTADTKSREVKRLRLYFRNRYDSIFDEKGYDGFGVFPLPGLHDLNIVPFSFSRFYTVCLQYPEYFDIFIAPKVPRAGNGESKSVTCEVIVQIRSYMLWMYGVHAAYEKSYEYVRAISDQFGLSIAFTQENRIDYCWHYRFKARLEFYLEYGKDENVRYEIQQLLSDEVTMGDKSVIRLAKALTPELNPIVNVEYQTMRRHSKTYQLVPFKDNSSHATSRRIYDYLDNRSIIIDYLTHQVFRYFRRITIEDNKISTHICKNIPVCTIIDVCLFYYFFYACNSMCIFPQR